MDDVLSQNFVFLEFLALKSALTKIFGIAQKIGVCILERLMKVFKGKVNGSVISFL